MVAQSDSYWRTKALKCQYEHIWHSNKTTLNRSRLRKQIARCNTLVNKVNGLYYSNLISENGQDSKKLCKALHRIPEKVIPSHESKKLLADQFVSIFSDKITKIRKTFSNADYFETPFPEHPGFLAFKHISDEKIRKIITKSPTKSGMLDPWPFLSCEIMFRYSSINDKTGKLLLV